MLFNEEIKDMEPLIIGYINDNGLKNNFDLIMAEIINLNIKGYLSIEYSKDKVNKYDYIIKQKFDIDIKNAKEYELLVLNFLFSKKMEITKTELEEKMLTSFNLYDVQFNQIEKVIEAELIKENILNSRKKQKLLANLLTIKANNYTEKGRELKKEIINYKEQIENKEFLTNNKSMEEIVKEKEFANSLVLHINTLAKSTFIYNKITENAKENSKKIAKRIIILSLIVSVIMIVLSKIVTSISQGGNFWLFLVLTIAVAASADITKEIAMSKRRK